jgi:hypothetical protein
MIPSTAPVQSRYGLVPAFLALFSIALFTSCQLIVGGRFEDTPTPALSPTGSISATPTIRATFTHLPGDVYFHYQTETAAPTAYPTIHWETPEALMTITPFYTLTAIALAVTESSCLLAYPDFCISPNVRLGCIALRRLGKHDFTVLAPDPYGYDKDNDGIGCDKEK